MSEVVSTEATGRRKSVQEGEHEAKHEEEGEEVCEDGGGSRNITIRVGEGDGTRRYAEGESRTGETKKRRRTRGLGGGWVGRGEEGENTHPGRKTE